MAMTHVEGPPVIRGVVSRIRYADESAPFSIVDVRDDAGVEHSCLIQGIPIEHESIVAKVSSWSWNDRYSCRQARVDSFEAPHDHLKDVARGLRCIEGITLSVAKSVAVSLVGDMSYETFVRSCVSNPSSMWDGIKAVVGEPSPRDGLSRAKSRYLDRTVLLNFVGFTASEIESMLTIRDGSFDLFGSVAASDGGDVSSLSRSGIWNLVELPFVRMSTVDRIFLALGGDVNDEERAYHHIVNGIRVLVGSTSHSIHPWIGVDNSDRSVRSKALRTWMMDGMGDGILDAHKARLIESGRLVAVTPVTARDSIGGRPVPGGLTSPQALAVESRVLSLSVRTSRTDGDVMLAPRGILSDEQYGAVEMALTNGLSIITGGPGTGKTTLTRKIAESRPGGVLFLSPTGKAARRLTAATGAEAHTIHRVWHQMMRGEGDAFAGRPVVLCDEASMVGTEIMRLLLDVVDFVGPKHLVMVGDPNQLQPVGHGMPFCDMISFLDGRVPRVTLSQIHRQDDDRSDIVDAAWTVFNRRVPEDSANVTVIRTNGDDETLAMIVDMLSGAENDEDMNEYDDFQVLAPQKKGRYGTTAINEAYETRRSGERGMSPGTKVIQIKNDYEIDVMNGDVGRVLGAHGDDSWLIQWFNKKEASFDVIPAWAKTIHKAQGSEYGHVVIPMMKDHSWMWRNTPSLLYTAITRARHGVVLVGDERTIVEAAMAGVETERRRTIMWWLHESGRLGGLMEDLSSASADPINLVRTALSGRTNNS